MVVLRIEFVLVRRIDEHPTQQCFIRPGVEDILVRLQARPLPIECPCGVIEHEWNTAPEEPSRDGNRTSMLAYIGPADDRRAAPPSVSVRGEHIEEVVTNDM